MIITPIKMFLIALFFATNILIRFLTIILSYSALTKVASMLLQNAYTELVKSIFLL